MTARASDLRSRLGRRRRRGPAALAVVVLGFAFLAGASTSAPPAGAASAVKSTGTAAPPTGGANGGSLEAAASKGADIGRKVAMSLIGLALAVAGTVLAFRRDFRKVAGVLVVGLLAVLLATPTGVRVFQDTVTTLFGAA